MTLQKRENESSDDWKYRLLELKINKETDLDWIELKEMLDLEETTDSIRKKARGAIEYKQYLDSKEEELLPENELDKLTIKKLELQKERNKLSSEKNELNKWIREQARSENIYEKIELAIEKLEPIKIPEIKVKSDGNKKIKTAVIDIADAHYGRDGKILGLHGETLAEYNKDIFARRMWELLERTVEICKKEDISFVTVLNASDSVDGMLRMSQLQFIQMGSVDQSMGFAEFISNWLNKLSEYVEINYYSALGNHSENRPMGSQRGDFQQENMERIIAWYAKERLKNNKNVTIHDPQVIQMIDVLGTNICLTHGQDERNLENSIKDYSMIYGKQIHILKTGHLHHQHSKTIGMAGLQNIEFVQSPSIAGIDEYSVKLKKTSNAGSLITLFESGYGKLCTYDIRLK